MHRRPTSLGGDHISGHYGGAPKIHGELQRLGFVLSERISARVAGTQLCGMASILPDRTARCSAW